MLQLRGVAFRATVFLSSLLLFLLELLAAKLLLPHFGASASVWSTSLVFFQVVLFGGYLYAAQATRWIARGLYGRLHLWLLMIPAVVSFPLAAHPFDLPPVLAVAASLAVGIGLPFLALSTTSVVVQAWLSRTDLPGRLDPTFLYGVSNAGALVALLTYPTLIEPALDLPTQLLLWQGAYAVLVLLHAAIVPRRDAGATPQPAVAAPVVPPPAEGPDRLDGAGPLAWLLFSAAPNALLVATTNAIALDASAPLLWVIPLSLFLLTLVVCFAPTPPSPRALAGLSLVALAFALASLVLFSLHIWVQPAVIVFLSSIMWVACLLCHAELVKARPQPSQLGRYYLLMSLGGALGSCLISLVIPVLPGRLASPVMEYAVGGALLAAAFALRDRARWAELSPGTKGFLGALALVVAGFFVFVPDSERFRARTFYGIYTVHDTDGLRWFKHGNTVHGVQWLDEARAGEPLAYYHRGSPIGAMLATDFPRVRVGVVGLGVGSMAAYARPSEQWTYYELDAMVERVAREQFSYLSRSAAPTSVVIGDARLMLAREPDATYDLLVLDAFSSDFVPLHLISREALALYLQKLKPNGLLVFHTSSRLLDLIPILAKLADSLHVQGYYALGAETDEGVAQGAFASIWVGLSNDGLRLALMEDKLLWQPLVVPERLQHERVWSDSYVNLFQAIRR
jgi:SAM-dependent methyltransferase